MPQYPYGITATYSPDRLIAGLTQLSSRNYVLLSGQKLARGAVVGLITASGKLVLSTSAAADGSQVPFGILADDYDATAGDLANVAIYEKGEFNELAVIFGTGQTIANTRLALRDAGIFLKSVVAA